MPVMVLYKDKSLSAEVADDICDEVAQLTKESLDAAIEVRIVEPTGSFNANEIHLEMAFRDFGEWSDDQLAQYHEQCMAAITKVLHKHAVHCGYSFYIIPTQPPRSIWKQAKI